MTILVSDVIYPLRISLYLTRVIYICVFNPANVNTMAENVYPVDTNVTIDGQCKGTIIVTPANGYNTGIQLFTSPEVARTRKRVIFDRDMYLVLRRSKRLFICSVTSGMALRVY